MRLYIDPNYTPPVIRFIKSLHDLQYPKTYEVVTGAWSETYNTSDTAVFLVDTNKQGLNALTLDQYADGFKVIAYRKPVGDAFDPFKCSLTLMSQWRKILDELENAKGKILISISNGKHPLRTVLKD